MFAVFDHVRKPGLGAVSEKQVLKLVRHGDLLVCTLHCNDSLVAETCLFTLRMLLVTFIVF